MQQQRLDGTPLSLHNTNRVLSANGVPKAGQNFDRLCCESDDKVTVYHCCTRRTVNGNYGPSLKENRPKDCNVPFPISICDNIENVYVVVSTF